MKKIWRIAGFVFALLFIFLPGLGASAAEAGVFDGAGLFDGGERAELQRKAEEISKAYDMNILVVTTDDAQGKDARDYADDYYMDNGYYDNEAKGGTLYLIDMDNREVYMCNAGDMIYYITDSRREDVLDAGYDQVANGEYYACIANMMGETVHWLERGIPADQYTYDEETGEIVRYRSIRPFEWGIAIVLALAAGGAAAGAVIGKYRMKWNPYKYPVKEKSSIRITGKEDRFVNQVVTTRVIPKNPPPSSDGGGGGGQTTIHTSSGGGTFSGGGRGF